MSLEYDFSGHRGDVVFSATDLARPLSSWQIIVVRSSRCATEGHGSRIDIYRSEGRLQASRRSSRDHVTGSILAISSSRIACTVPVVISFLANLVSRGK